MHRIGTVLFCLLAVFPGSPCCYSQDQTTSTILLQPQISPSPILEALTGGAGTLGYDTTIAGGVGTFNYDNVVATISLPHGGILQANGDINSLVAPSAADTLSLNVSTQVIAGQPTATGSMKLDGSNPVTYTNGQITTIGSGGLLRTGNNTTTINPQPLSFAGTNSSNGWVIRTDQTSDILHINTPIVTNGINPLTKSGTGALILNGNNSYSGLVTFIGTSGTTGTVINGGVLQLNTGISTINSGSLVLSPTHTIISSTGQLTVNSGVAYILHDNSTISPTGVVSGSPLARISHQPFAEHRAALSRS
jgi:fibronectin-binding autotransporter adhesin